jgi:hypothetical protein
MNESQMCRLPTAPTTTQVLVFETVSKFHPESRNRTECPMAFVSATTLVFPHRPAALNNGMKHINLKIFVTL